MKVLLRGMLIGLVLTSTSVTNAEDDLVQTRDRPSSSPSLLPSLVLSDHDQASEELKIQLQAIWSGANLRAGTTAIHVVDANSGEALYSVHADQALNPASNVKLISTGTVLATLGPNWRYQTRALGALPDPNGVVEGGLYLYGNFDPTIGPGALKSLAQDLFQQGVRTVAGDIVLEDSGRDSLATNRVRITVRGASPGRAARIETWPESDLLVVHNAKVKSRKRGRSRVRLQRKLVEQEGEEATQVHVNLSGTIRRGHKRILYAKMPSRSQFTASVFRKALVSAGIQVVGTLRSSSFEDFNTELSRSGRVPWPLASHQSATIAALVKRVNKRSLNHLADRLVMSAAQSIHGGPLSMSLAVGLMKQWLSSIGVDADHVVLDTGSGLSYRTRLTTKQIVKVLRAAGGYTGIDLPTETLETFRDSLAIGGIDGTLRRRFRGQDVALHSHMNGKTGTLRKVIALSGFLAREDGRTICFSIVTNGHPNHRKRVVRLEHEHLVAKLDSFLSSESPSAPPAPIEIPSGAHTTKVDAQPSLAAALRTTRLPAASQSGSHRLAPPSCGQAVARQQPAAGLESPQHVPASVTQRLAPLR